METNLYPYMRRDLFHLILQTPGVIGYTNFTYSHSGYYEVKFCDKYLYITFTDKGLYIVIETPERRQVPSKSVFHEDHFKFRPTDKLWIKDSLDYEELGSRTAILNIVNETDFKNKYGFSFYSLAARFRNIQ